MVEASDHAVMQRVGQAVFRPLRRGNFRYGPLAYQIWDDAFAAPNPVTMVARLETTAAARPRDAHAYNRLAVGQFAVGERDAAVETLGRAAELEPDWSLPYWNLAIAHLHRGDLAAAARAQQRAGEIDRIAAGAEPQSSPVGSAPVAPSRVNGSQDVEVPAGGVFLPDTTTSRR